MLLEDFLQLLAGLGGQNVLYLQVQDQTLPLSKFVLAREDCQLLCGGQAMTLAKFRQLTGKGSKSIPPQLLLAGKRNSRLRGPDPAS